MHQHTRRATPRYLGGSALWALPLVEPGGIEFLPLNEPGIWFGIGYGGGAGQG